MSNKAVTIGSIGVVCICIITLMLVFLDPASNPEEEECKCYNYGGKGNGPCRVSPASFYDINQQKTTEEYITISCCHEAYLERGRCQWRTKDYDIKDVEEKVWG